MAFLPPRINEGERRWGNRSNGKCWFCEIVDLDVTCRVTRCDTSMVVRECEGRDCPNMVLWTIKVSLLPSCINLLERNSAHQASLLHTHILSSGENHTPRSSHLKFQGRCIHWRQAQSVFRISALPERTSPSEQHCSRVHKLLS